MNLIQNMNYVVFRFGMASLGCELPAGYITFVHMLYYIKIFGSCECLRIM
jgi:hypothetical protein